MSGPETNVPILIFTRSHPRSLLSMARSKSARSRNRPSRSRKNRIAQICRGFRARFAPTFRPAFHAGLPSSAGSCCEYPIFVLQRPLSQARRTMELRFPVPTVIGDLNTVCANAHGALGPVAVGLLSTCNLAKTPNGHRPHPSVRRSLPGRKTYCIRRRHSFPDHVPSGKAVRPVLRQRPHSPFAVARSEEQTASRPTIGHAGRWTDICETRVPRKRDVSPEQPQNRER